MNEHARNLRQLGEPDCCDECKEMLAAAAEIERLEKENALLRRSLEMLTKELAAAGVPA